MKQKLVFAVNGEKKELSNVDPCTTLLDFLRTQTPYRAPKLGCGEGGCGACLVLISKYNPETRDLEEHSVSSCLTLLCSLHNCSVTTSEGLGNQRDGFHSIHQRIAGFHASQCGFCTPGMCISLYSSLSEADKSSRPEPPPGFSKLTVSEAERAVAGNLCRCTGYRPIIDACKSFCADVDMEDLGLNSFCKKGETLDISKLPPYAPKSVCTFPESLKNESEPIDEFKERKLNLVYKSELGEPEDGCWITPTNLEELMEILRSEENGNRVKLVAGNTSTGYYKNQGNYQKYIDIRHIPELSMIKREKEGIDIGAGVTLSKVIEVLDEEISSRNEPHLVFKKVVNHLNMVASKFVRNMASLGGNLVMAQRNEFPSDIATILLGACSSVIIRTPTGTLSLSLEEFLGQPPCDPQTLLVSVRIPSWSGVPLSKTEGGNELYSLSLNNGTGEVEGESELLFETYRAAPYPLGGALAYVNAAFMAEVLANESTGELVLGHLSLAFGAYGTKHAIRARKVEEYLKGKSITHSVLLEAIQILKMTVVPREGTSKPDYRSSLVVGFLFDFFSPLITSSGKLNKSTINDLVSAASNPESNIDKISNACNGESRKSTSGISSKQVVEIHNDYHPVGYPTKKVSAELQASGEAVYTDDIPSPKDCLYGAFVYSRKPFAHIKHIEVESALASPGVVSFVSAKDIPNGGQNVGLKAIFGEEPMFADDLTEFAGQPLGVMVAETRRLAKAAADQVKVSYDTQGLEPPILSVEEAIKRSSFFEIPLPPPFIPQQVGDFSKGMAEADHKILSFKVETGSQYHFYMETQTAMAVPDEDNCLTVYTSCQMAESTQVTIAKCLGIPEHNVRIITRRVGGGFGGKATRAIPVAVACAVSAFKLRRPVRMYLDRQTDMIMIGGRHPMKMFYTVGFKADGKITAVHVDCFLDAGYSVDLSPIIPYTMTSALKKYNYGALSFNFKACKTNFPSKSAMRAPGDVQGAFLAETIIEHVASTLSMDANSIREKNLHNFESLKLFYGTYAGDKLGYTLPLTLEKVIILSNFNQRTKEIREFNCTNRWRKRGMSILPIIYAVSVRPTPGKVSILNDGSIVVEVGGIELGQGLWTKVKQMTAFALGRLWKDGNDELYEKVRVVQADTISMVQGGMTAGSTTSESSCEAVRVACDVLGERLSPIKKTLLEKAQEVSWDALVKQAYFQSVNMSASAYWVPDSSSNEYLNYGAAASEVEINLLTGASTILRTDMVYDCGRSLNPAMDLGQIEGAFVQGIGFFVLEEHVVDSDGMVTSNGTWTYKIPNLDTIPKQFNVEMLSTGLHQDRVLSSKASGEPPLLLAGTVHCAIREAIKEARKDLHSYKSSSNETIGEECSATFRMDTPATIDVVKRLCGLDNVERYLQSLVHHH
ncbi:indole-3-acetaldehyde oxidase [Amborella trichopoda]|uniref:indole-3-acetaldehyde oxidase n=1 Tax=Amborella trichopoda TaxID=13333 RepID=UPI0005D36FD6|nr:indole-3-acetaldehyde oxidase [Amborella trichopoda]|eukprot:XP_011621346.1 indole-3-acetaldehyde oxidase [Amborella trichopoda]